MVINDIIINTIIILLLYNTYDLLVVTNLPKLSSIQYHSFPLTMDRITSIILLYFQRPATFHFKLF